ncbi:MAG: glycosyltransferase [Comamonas sp.]
MNDHDLGFVPGLSRGIYVFDKAHALLAEDAWKATGPNIGRNGENLTISFLSLNRAGLSIKLLQSIEKFMPHFAGEVLIVDNGSASDELAMLRDFCSGLTCRYRVVELGRNYGVSGGRNRTLPHVHTEWLMCLDNDIYFTSNPLAKMQQDLAVLGCHFMSFPLLEPDGETIFARGGHLFVSHYDGQLHIGAGSAVVSQKVQNKMGYPFLSTFLFGGACVVKKTSFLLVGGYDEGMFVGFEDIDFSIRLFQSGYKVATASECFLVHDHPMPDSGADRDYERERFSRQVLKESADYLEKKHGLAIWSDVVDQWLESRQNALGLGVEFAAPAVSAAEVQPKDGKTKIALIIDTDNWAFGNIARQLENHLSDRFDFIVIPMDIIDNIDQVLVMARHCQIVHFFWREHLTLIGTPYFRSYAENLGMSYEQFHERFIASKQLSTSIYDHLLLDAQDLSARAHIFSEVIAGYTVGSQKLQAIYSEVPGYPAPTALIEDGVDLRRFKPRNLARLQEVGQRPLVIGWVGNSKWAGELEDFKGVHSILKPAIERLQREGVCVTSLFADRQERFIPHDQMPEYYSKIDLYVCTSKIEGTPNPVLEAMACGIPVISTDVGIVPQAFGALQKEFILPERSVEALMNSIRSIVRAPELLTRLSQENLERIQAWDWSIKAEKFGAYFDRLLEARKASTVRQPLP